MPSGQLERGAGVFLSASPGAVNGVDRGGSADRIGVDVDICRARGSCRLRAEARRHLVQNISVYACLDGDLLYFRRFGVPWED